MKYETLTGNIVNACAAYLDRHDHTVIDMQHQTPTKVINLIAKDNEHNDLVLVNIIADKDGESIDNCFMRSDLSNEEMRQTFEGQMMDYLAEKTDLTDISVRHDTMEVTPLDNHTMVIKHHIKAGCVC